MSLSLFQSVRSCATLTLIVASLGCGTPAQLKANDKRAPQVPAEIQVPKGHKVRFHGYAEGVQIYTWNGINWGSSVPEAVLYDKHDHVVAIHYAGPTWESDDGSYVVGALPPQRVTVDPNSIPWLLLGVAHAEGPGVFKATTFIHRVNTVGGNPPTVPGTVIGQVARVPYSADYFFYRGPKNK